MCFSATASFTAGATLSVLGIATLTQIRSRRELLLGVFPLLFAIQQFVEGLVWLTIDQTSLNTVNSLLAYSFLLFATGLWPVLCPLAVYLLESNPSKRGAILAIVMFGIMTGIYLFSSVIIHGVSSNYFSGNLLYDLKFIPFYEFNKYLYLIVTSVPFLIASDRRIKLYGALGIVSFGVAELFYKVTFVSVWCFFAAVLSGGLYFIFRDFNLKVIEVSRVRRDAPYEGF
ncbi:MAG: hypothetical protein F6K28_39635 [Microcoleus sp. SIO2G3]|nr:hypothetical protein [Microcoleus sp. SIO2G3]